MEDFSLVNRQYFQINIRKYFLEICLKRWSKFQSNIHKAEGTLHQPKQQRQQTKYIPKIPQLQGHSLNQNVKEQIKLFQAGQTKHLLFN